MRLPAQAKEITSRLLAPAEAACTSLTSKFTEQQLALEASLKLAASSLPIKEKLSKDGVELRVTD